MRKFLYLLMFLGLAVGALLSVSNVAVEAWGWEWEPGTQLVTTEKAAGLYGPGHWWENALQYRIVTKIPAGTKLTVLEDNSSLGCHECRDPASGTLYVRVSYGSINCWVKKATLALSPKENRENHERWYILDSESYYLTPCGWHPLGICLKQKLSK